MHRFLAALLAWLFFAAAPLVVHAQELQAGGIMGNPSASRAPATDATLQALINQNPALTIPNPTITGTLSGGPTIAGSPTFSGNVIFQGTIKAASLAVPGSIASSLCQDSSGNFLTVAAINCFGGAAGSGTVNSGTINQLAWYAGTGTAISGLATANNGTLVTSAGGVPSISSTLPAAVQANITGLGTVTTGVWNGTAIGLTYGGLGGSQAAATVNQFPVFPGGGGAAVPTSFATFLSNVCSSSIGQYWVQLSGGWGCTSIGWANPVWWGADAAGTSDSASAFNSALAASAIVRFPPGKFKLNSAISFTFPATTPWSQTVEGAGAGATTLLWPNAAGGLTLAMSSQQHSSRVAHLRFATSQAGGGTGLSITQSQCLASFAMSTFQDLMFNGDDNSVAHYWTIAAHDNEASGTTWFDNTMYGKLNGDGTGTGIGLQFDGPTTCGGPAGSTIYHYVVMDTINQMATAVQMGTGVQGLFVNTVNIQNGTNGIVVPAGTAGSPLELSVIGSQIATHATGIDLEATINYVTIAENLFLPAGSNAAIKINSNTATGGVIANNITVCGGAGFGVYTIASNWNIIGNWINICAIGVELDTGAKQNLVTSNEILGATNAVLINGNSSTNQQNAVVNNLLIGSGSAVVLSASAKNNYVWNNVNLVGGVSDSGSGDVIGQACSGTPTVSFASNQGVVTHC